MIAIIVAVSENGVIGKNNKLPWDIQEEFNLFQNITKDATIIMGRKTYDSIGRGMLNRKNIVVSTTHTSLPGVEVVSSIGNALAKAQLYHKDIFVIGGSDIYKEFFALADTMFISYIKGNYEGDTYFPEFDDTLWEITETREFEEFTFVKYEKKN